MINIRAENSVSGEERNISTVKNRRSLILRLGNSSNLKCSFASFRLQRTVDFVPRNINAEEAMSGRVQTDHARPYHKAMNEQKAKSIILPDQCSSHQKKTPCYAANLREEKG